ncbi:hypothetical protein QP157_18270 [Sphingomonas sp. LR61]|uniref:hypothetical protein n=1 Tax=Sphingomonas sp. LR61 TaxID=3050234 RepID=UPI002FDF268F
MVEQNNDNTTNDENAPKRRTRLFGGRRARSSGQQVAADAVQVPAVDEPLALTDGHRQTGHRQKPCPSRSRPSPRRAPSRTT